MSFCDILSKLLLMFAFCVCVYRTVEWWPGFCMWEVGVNLGPAYHDLPWASSPLHTSHTEGNVPCNSILCCIYLLGNLYAEFLSKSISSEMDICRADSRTAVCAGTVVWLLNIDITTSLSTTAWDPQPGTNCDWALEPRHPGCMCGCLGLSFREASLCLPRPSRQPEHWTPLDPVWVCVEEVRQTETCQGSAPSHANKIHFVREVLSHLGHQRVFLPTLQLVSSTYQCEVLQPSLRRPVQDGRCNSSPSSNT